MFDLTTVVTKDRQMSALRELQSLAAASWSTLQEDKKSMRDMLRELSPHGRTSNHFLESSAHVSSAEATMEHCSPEDSHPSPAIQTNYQNPAIGAQGAPVSDFAPKFRGCLGCSIPDHVFRSCPMKNDPAAVTRASTGISMLNSTDLNATPPASVPPLGNHLHMGPHALSSFPLSHHQAALQLSVKLRPLALVEEMLLATSQLG
jgi:hypothetical protein